MQKRKKSASWRTYALAAVLWAAAALIQTNRVRAGMVSRGAADGMSVLLMLVFLVDAVAFTVRAVWAFHAQRSDNKLTEDINITDGGTTYDREQ